MGAWGEGPFENDGSLDALARLRETDQASAEAHIREMLQGLLDEEYVDSHDAQGAVGIAALLAHLESPEPDPAFARAAERITLTVTPELRALAARTLRRVQDPADNEWFELWDEGGDGFGETMIRSLDRYRDTLEKPGAAV